MVTRSKIRENGIDYEYYYYTSHNEGPKAREEYEDDKANSLIDTVENLIVHLEYDFIQDYSKMINTGFIDNALSTGVVGQNLVNLIEINTKIYMKHGKSHNLYGPAIVYLNEVDRGLFFIDGEVLMEDEFKSYKRTHLIDRMTYERV